MRTISEADVEQATLDWLESLGRSATHGLDIAPGTPNAERGDYGRMLLERRPRNVLAELNSDLPSTALDDALRKLTRPQSSILEARNRAFHRLNVQARYAS